MVKESQEPTRGKAKTKKTLLPPWWGKYVAPVLRQFIIPLVCVAALFVGLTVGYVYLGDHPFEDVLKMETWKHLYDLIFADT